MPGTLFRVAGRVTGLGLLYLLMACGDAENAEPEADDSGIEIAEAETQTRPDTVAAVTQAESPRLDEAEEIEGFEAAELDEAAEIEEIDAFEGFEQFGDGEIDPLEAMYDEFRTLEPLESEQAMFAVENADPLVRAHGAWNLEPEGEGLDNLLRLAAYDPDPVVRIAALASLEEAESFAAFKGLIDALQDPDSDVVVAAIDSIEYAGDASNVRDLEPLLVHPDERVARAAAKAIEFLAD